MEDCLACDLIEGRRTLPGGRIAETAAWIVEHCIGPLGVGTLLVKPKRHVTRVAALSASETAELGPLLQRAAAVVDELVDPEQVYVCLWSHAGRVPVHIHYVVQPATTELIDEHGAFGPGLQVAMFQAGVGPAEADVAAFAERAKALFDR